MLNLHASREHVYAVLKPVRDPFHPGRLLAEPGDEVVVRSNDPDFPLTVVRQLPIDMAMAFPEDAVRLASDAPLSVVQGSAEPCPPAPAQSPRLLRRVG